MKKNQLTTRNRALILLLTFVFSIIAINPVLIPSSQAQSQGGDTFSIMQISDTHIFLRPLFHNSFWTPPTGLHNHATEYNLRMVIHTGDIVDNIGVNAQPQLATADPAQWSVANQAMTNPANCKYPVLLGCRKP